MKMTPVYHLRRIEVTNDWAINQISFVYDDGQTWSIGNKRGTKELKEVILDNGEYLVRVTHEKYFQVHFYVFFCVFLPSAYREGSVVHFYVYFYFVKLMKFVNLIFVLYWPSLNLSVMFHDDDFHEADVNYRFLFFPHFISTMYKVLPIVIIFRNAITINYIQYKF